MRQGATAGGFQIRGAEGLMDVTEGRVRLMNAAAAGWQEIDLGLGEGGQAIGGDTNAAQVRELLQWLEGEVDEHRGSGAQARVTVEIMMGLYESARRRRVIHFPLQEKEYPLGLMIEAGDLPVEAEGGHDIRGHKSWEGIDPARYRALRREGVAHGEAMRRLHAEMEG